MKIDLASEYPEKTDAMVKILDACSKEAQRNLDW